MDDKKFTFSMLKRFSFIPLPLIIVTAVIIYIVDIRTIYEPYLLLPILNTIFTSGGGFIIALITASAYVFGAKRQALFLGGGTLALGISALLAGWIFSDSLNVAVTIFSIGSLLAAVLHVLGSAQSTENYLTQYSMKKFPRQSIAILFYSGIAIFFVIVSVTAVRGLFPPFFVAGEGYTPIRWVIIIAYLILFFTSVSLYARLYYFSKEGFLYWYSLGLAIIAVGLTLAPLGTPGGPLNWLGRIAQYLGSIYFLIAAVSALKEARAKGMGLAQKLSNIWREPAISYSMLVSMARDAIISIDNEGKVLVWSPAAERLFGYSQNESIGSPFASLIAADEQADSLIIQLDHSDDINNDLADKNRVELELRRKNGETFTAELSVSVGDTPSGRLRMAVIRDITERKQAEEALRKAHDELELRVRERTAELAKSNEALQAEIAERKQAEEALRESEERLKLAQKAANAGTWDWNMLTGELKWSEEYYLVYGLTMDYEPSYENWLKTIHPDDRDMANKAISRAIEQKIDIDIVFRTIHPDGNLCWLNAKGKTFYDEANRPIRMIGITLDISQRKQAEEKIQEQADLLDKAKDAILVQDLEHRITYYNQGAQHLYGYTKEEAFGKNADELLYKEESSQLIEAKKRVIEKGEWMGELRQITRDGNEIIAESRWTLVHNDGKLKSILIINTDITEKKNLEAHLLRAQRMESIGILAGGIAHNLNNMLTPMMMSLHMLKQKFKDEQSQKLLTILENNSHRSADLIKQVLSFSRGVEGERNPLQAKNIITEIEKVAKETFPRNIEIRTNIQNDLFTIPGDATQLYQVIMNLCVNARDAMPDGGILSISTENFLIDESYSRMHTEAKVGSYVAIAVSDTGIGIPPKILDRIFEPFFTTKEFGKGTGLGLSTALAIVKSHGGFINVESEVGKGTMFRVYLPAIKTEMQNVEEQKLELLIGHGELVLVAEDEDSVREVTISTLKQYGYSVLAANDGVQAVAGYAQNKDKVEVVLVDMMMPVMDGHESIRAIRKINPEVKIIAVSGLAEKEKLKNVAEYTNAFLPKPYTAERLLKAIHEVLSAK